MNTSILQNDTTNRDRHDTSSSVTATEIPLNSSASIAAIDTKRDFFFIEEIDVVPAESVLAHRT